MLLFFSFSMSPFDLICSFGLVVAEQLIQQTCLMRCEACTQIQLLLPAPASLLCSPARGGVHVTGCHRPGVRGRRPGSKPVTSEADRSSAAHMLTLCPPAGRRLPLETVKSRQNTCCALHFIQHWASAHVTIFDHL